MRKYFDLVLFGVWCVLTGLDAAATTYGIQAGYAYELNPLCAWFLDRGTAAFYGFKALCGLLVGGLLLFVRRERSVTWLLILGVGLYALLDLWHLVIFLYFAA